MKLLDSEVIYKGSIFSLRKDKIEIDNNLEVIRDVIEHPGAVVILPVLANGNLIVIKQYRHSIGRHILEFPAGALEAGEDPDSCASRELMEEIGKYPNSLKSIGTLYPTPGFCDEIQYCYVAKDLIDRKLEGDIDEQIEVLTMTPSELELSMKNNEFCDAKSIAIYYKAKILGMVA